MRNVARNARTAAEQNMPLELPLEECINDDGGDPFFAIHFSDGFYTWEFHDGTGHVPATCFVAHTKLEDCLEQIKSLRNAIRHNDCQALRIV